MIDLLRIAIPFDEVFVVGDTASDRISGLIDLKECNLRGAKLESGNVTFNDGQYDFESLRHPYESLPSSWSTLSFKIHAGGSTYWPFIEIKASPAKLLQGHNVYGSDDVRLCVESLVTTFNMGMPRLAEMLDFRSAEIKQIDCTFTAHLDSEADARNIITVLRNLSSGQTRSSKSAHETTAYWGVKSSNDGQKSSRRKQLKAYLKHFELQHQIKETEHKLKITKKDVYKRQLEAMTAPEVLAFAQNSLRFEASILPKTFKRLGFPTHVGDFVRHCENLSRRCCPIQYLWDYAWKDIFKTFEGKQVNIYNDDDVRAALRAEYFTVTKTGKTTYSKADRLFRFVRSLKHEGWDEVKATMPERTFYRTISEVSSVIPKSYLQNLQASASSNVVPLVRFVNVDFSKQHPANWHEPKPLHQQLRQTMRLAS
ncbi:phage/plasmid replication protein, II/X family [Shewanella mesophila]|uniref:phage/plasmid replication protein, II/X family n=1 Tax=Shewanella mesophila TaxID=2864208 RepID=UPI001C65A7C9|nr:phage/plasmid replication protein, II/X family [Shewanella mesophila]QYJ87854.1 phage/plasmid replication protein, II/X family [Shewanella mesophila]QYJ87862.1 phage/plasmid replication protein, II/X family [Shewanella mesophila]QYJ87870.1 phage/plasmid replication protein, II/X family [Shewanella mesophila]